MNQYELQYPAGITPQSVKEAAEGYTHSTTMAEAAEEAGLSAEEFKAVRKVHRLRKSGDQVAGVEYDLPKARAEMVTDQGKSLHSGFRVEGQQQQAAASPDFTELQQEWEEWEEQRGLEPGELRAEGEVSPEDAQQEYEDYLGSVLDKADYDGDLQALISPELKEALEEARTQVGGDAGRQMEELLLRRAQREKQGIIPDDTEDYDLRSPESVISDHEATADIEDGLAAATITAGDLVPQVRRLSGKAVDTSSLEKEGIVAYLHENKPPVLVPAETDEWMRKAYSDWDGYKMKSDQIAEMVGMSKAEFRRYRSRRGWTRDMNPLAAAQMVTMSVDEIEEELAGMKSRAVKKRLRKKERREAEKKAQKWDDLEASVVDGMRGVIESIPEVQLGQTPRFPAHDNEATHRLVLPLNDWQIGSYADAEELRFGDEFSLEVAEMMVEDYIRQLGEYLDRNQGAKFGTPIICLLGDILHGLGGETMSGTKLAKHMREYDWAQMRAAVRLVNRVVDYVMSVFGDMEIISLPGNHAGAASQVLGEMLYQRWRREIDEDAYAAPNNRTHFQMIGNSLFVFDHGASYDSGVHGGKIARSGSRRDLQIKDLVYTRADLVDQARKAGGGVYFVMGDQHHTVDESAAGVELIKLPAMPSGDVYADHNGWHSRPSQGILLVNQESGLSGFERFYFDRLDAFVQEAVAA